MPTPETLAPRAADLLASLIKIPTVSRPEGEPYDVAAFDAHVEALLTSFPLLAAACERETVGPHGQFWRWPGRDAGRAIVLMAHQDVVPALREDGWSRDPFSGEIAEGRVHGRGALDDKGDLVSTLLAAETLLEEGFEPAVDVYFALGDNEEVAGSSAAAMAALLSERGVRPELVLDEGGAVAAEAFPGVKRPQAMVGLGEKGLLSVRLTVRSEGGHASAPPRVGAVDRLTSALTRLRRRPFPARLTPVTSALLAQLGSRAGGVMAPVLRGVAAAGPVGAALLARLGGEPAALVRTTVAVTRLEGSEANNVLAARASAVLNLRLAPWDSVDGALARLRRVIRDRRVELEVLESNDPSPVSDPHAAQLELLREALAVSHPHADLAPYVTLAATDARRFHGVSPNVYRLAPLEMDAAERGRIHGVDESVRVEALGRGVAFYRELLARL
ncbi:MAG: M20/M25/M40 family metallo-hydrolase [Arthrobacter sp.]|jgi:carboxypeptidase PM20D1|nr:M20/M25/M40 family metallo-hydrolase [Arthrobacter sp.]